MSLIASQADYAPADPIQGATASYYQPAGGSGYQATESSPQFTARINSLKGRAAPKNQKLAIWGCVFGRLVELAVAAGYDAYGFDASAWAIGQGQVIRPATASRLFVRDMTAAADVTASRSDAGISGNARFALLVNDDVLPCLSDAEINVALPLLRGSCSANLLHAITFLDPTTTQDQRYNWKSGAQWKALLSPPDLTYDIVNNVVI